MKIAIRLYFSSIGWLIHTIARVFVRDPGAFSIATVLTGVLRIMQFLVMVLPIKVVLLASHEGVPSYTPFIYPEQKTEWIVGLAIGTILAYILTQILDSLAERICEKAGVRLMAEAAALNIVSNQRDQARSIFADLSSVLADMMFWGAGMVLYFLISPTTFFVYFGLVVVSFLVGTMFSVSKSKTWLRGPYIFITERTGTYLGFNSIVIFFVCFLVILYPYVAGVPENLLIGLISIMLLRRTLGALFDSVRGAIKLIGKRHLVDALMFRDRQFTPRPKPDQQKLWEMFAPAKRFALVKDMLSLAALDKQLVSVEWVDPMIAGVVVFNVTCADDTHYQLQAFPSRSTYALDNENTLFAIVDRGAVGAPEVIGETVHGDFTCRLLDAGDGVETSVSQWRSAHESAIVRLLAVRPDDELVNIYRSTHMLTYEKLTADFIRRVRIAVRNNADKAAMLHIVSHLDDIREKLAKLPLTISSAHFSKPRTFANGEDLPLFMYWGNWSLEPLGGGVLLTLGPKIVEDILQRVRELRSDIPGTITSSDLRLANRVQHLVVQIERGSYAAAIDTIVEMKKAGLYGPDRSVARGEPKASERKQKRAGAPKPAVPAE